MKSMIFELNPDRLYGSARDERVRNILYAALYESMGLKSAALHDAVKNALNNGRGPRGKILVVCTAEQFGQFIMARCTKGGQNLIAELNAKPFEQGQLNLNAYDTLFDVRPVTSEYSQCESRMNRPKSTPIVEMDFAEIEARCLAHVASKHSTDFGIKWDDLACGYGMSEEKIEFRAAQRDAVRAELREDIARVRGKIADYRVRHTFIRGFDPVEGWKRHIRTLEGILDGSLSPADEIARLRIAADRFKAAPEWVLKERPAKNRCAQGLRAWASRLEMLLPEAPMCTRESRDKVVKLWEASKTEAYDRGQRIVELASRLNALSADAKRQGERASKAEADNRSLREANTRCHILVGQSQIKANNVRESIVAHMEQAASDAYNRAQDSCPSAANALRARCYSLREHAKAIARGDF